MCAQLCVIYNLKTRRPMPYWATTPQKKNYNRLYPKSNKGLKKNLEAIPGKHSIYSLQKTDILGKSHIISKYCTLKIEA